MDRGPTRKTLRDRDISEYGELKNETIDVKKNVNSLQQQNVHLNTRMKTVDKEMNRRMRVLKELWALSKANLPLTQGVMDRLNDDKNGQALYRQRCNLLEEALLDREEEISELKHQETFTKIVELEGAFTALRSEAKRFQSLSEAPDVKVNEAAQSEVLVYQQLFETLEKELASLQRLDMQQGHEITEKQEDYQILSTNLRESEEELSYELQQLEDATVQYRALVGASKEKESMLRDLQLMQEAEVAKNMEISKMDAQLKKLVSQSTRGRYNISSDKFDALDKDTIALLGRIRGRWTANDADFPDSPTFLLQLLEASHETDMVTVDTICEIVERFGLNVEREAVARAVQRLSEEGDEECGLLDFFIACLLSPLECSIPDPNGEKIKNLKQSMSFDTFRNELFEVTHSREISAMLGHEWARVWEVYGAGGMLLRTPPWDPPSDSIKLRLRDSSSDLQSVLNATDTPITTQEELTRVLDACADAFFSPRDIQMIMSMYASTPDLRVALLETIS